jgi:uridine phosphorylase
MVTDDRDILIQPRQGHREAGLPHRALLVVNPAEAHQAMEMCENGQWTRRRLYGANLMVHNSNSLCIAGPALGAPAAGLLLEKLIVLGAREIFLVSCCGAVDPAFSVGDIVLGTAAVSGVGLTRYYAGSEEMHAGPGVLGTCRTMLSKTSLDFRAGSVWSTDAPYRERRSELIGLQEEFGICGVDMEYAALLAIGAYRSVSLVGLFVVSDTLWSKTWQPGFTRKQFRQRSAQLGEAVITYLQNMEGR